MVKDFSYETNKIEAFYIGRTTYYISWGAMQAYISVFDFSRFSRSVDRGNTHSVHTCVTKRKHSRYVPKCHPPPSLSRGNIDWDGCSGRGWGDQYSSTLGLQFGDDIDRRALYTLVYARKKSLSSGSCTMIVTFIFSGKARVIRAHERARTFLYGTHPSEKRDRKRKRERERARKRSVERDQGPMELGFFSDPESDYDTRRTRSNFFG